MGSHDGAINKMDRPVELTLPITKTLEFSPDDLPNPLGGPATKTAVNGGPFAESIGNIPPGCPGPQNPDNAANNGTMVEVRTAQANQGRQEGEEALPLSVRDFFSHSRRKYCLCLSVLLGLHALVLISQ